VSEIVEAETCDAGATRGAVKRQPEG